MKSRSGLATKPYQCGVLLLFSPYCFASPVVSSWFRRVCLIRWNSSLPISPLAYRFSAISNAVSGVRPSIQYAHGGRKPSRAKNSRQATAMTIIIAIHIIGKTRMPRIREWLVVISAISRSGYLTSQTRARRSHVNGEVHTSPPHGIRDTFRTSAYGATASSAAGGTLILFLGVTPELNRY